MEKQKNPFIVFTDFIFWMAFTLYLSGGFTVGGKSYLDYIGDMARVCAGLALIFLTDGVEFRRLSFIRAFVEVNDALVEHRRPRTTASWVVTASMIYLGVLFFLAPLVRHWSFGTWLWDLGALEQVIWRGANGLGLSSTVIGNSFFPFDYIGRHHLGLWLVPVSYIYKFFPSTETLLILQSAALLSSVIPLWKMARRLLPKEVPPLVPVLLLWMTGNFHRVNIWDVHENAFVILPSLWAFYFFLEGRYLWTMLMTLGVAIFKEDAWVMAGAMGGFFFLQKQQKALALISMAAGMGIFLYYGSHHSVTYIPLSMRYAYLGDNIEQAKHVVLTRPWIFLIQLFSFRNFELLWQTLQIGGGLWIFGGTSLIPAAPTFFEVALSTDPNMAFVKNHYVTPMIGVLSFAALWGLHKLDSRIKDRRKLRWLVASAVILSLLQMGALTGTTEIVRVKDILRSEAWQERHCRSNLVSKIPQDIPLYACEPFVTHVSHRPILWSYNKGDKMVSGSWALLPEGDATPPSAKVMAQSCGYKLIENLPNQMKAL